MKISIITVCYNAAKTIRDACASVAAQAKVKDEGEGEQRIEIEHIVIDGGSTDGTVDVIREFERQFYSSPSPLTFTFRWLSEKDNGMYDAMNKGIRMATGDVIGILNADDVLDGENVLQRIARLFDRSDCSIDCLYGNVRFVSEKGERGEKGEKGERGERGENLARLRALPTVRICFARWWKPWMLQWGYMPPHPAIFIRRECFGKWGFYEPSRKEYRIAADYELLIRFFRVHRMKARYMPICTTVMRTGGVSTKDVEARKKLNEEIVKANRANGYFCIFPMLLPKYFVKIWEFVVPRVRR